MHTVQITAGYAALLGIMFTVITLRIALVRYTKRISLGDGGDRGFEKLIRAHANFSETTPIALLLIFMLELQGTQAITVHTLGVALLAGRVLHYLQVSGMLRPLMFRTVGMVLTLSVVMIASLRLFFGLWA